MEELKYYLVGIDNVFLNSKIELMMDIIEFSKFIRNNGIYNVFIGEYSEKFTAMKNITQKFKDSKIFFAFDCNKELMLWTDSWGYLSIEDYEESSENSIFYTINRLKKEYSSAVEWHESTGHIYQLLRSMGYKTSEDVEESYRFFQGNLFRYETYEKVREFAKKGEFENITQLIISSNATFENVYDYYDAMEMKAPNMKTLLSMRLIEEIERKYKFENFTSALLFAVMLKLKKSMKDSKGEQEISLHEIKRELEGHFPKNVCEGFRKVESDEDIIDIIQNEYGFSTIGFYNEHNKYFYFSKLKVYIDASNVIHNGKKKGGKNENTDKPKIKFLEECIRSLEEQEIKVTGVYLDYSKKESLMLQYREQNDKFQELKRELIDKGIMVTETMKGEIADDRLTRKLKDDKNCYVVSNDSFEEFHLLRSERKRVINFERMSDGKYRFSIEFYENREVELKEFIAEKNEDLDKYEKVTSLENIGDWPYPDKYKHIEILNFLYKL